MKRWSVLLMMALSLAGCRKGPITAPTKDVPAGRVEIEFVNNPNTVSRMWRSSVSGPVDLSLNGTRIPVTQSDRGGRRVVITGLTPGTYRYFLSSPKDAFGPDQGTFTVTADKGTYVLLFNQRFDGTLYGSQDALPKAEGMPGIKATLE